MLKYAILLLIIIQSSFAAQTFTIKGNISDSETNKFLSFANVRIAGTNFGTAANINGDYNLKSSKRDIKLIASFIGYKSDTVNLDLSKITEHDFKLQPKSIRLPEVTVLPGVNPAIAIIKRAQAAKKKRKEAIATYEYRAFTKTIIKTTEDISANSNSVGLSIGEADTAQLKITGIFENESIGYFKDPDNFKEEIVARKQSKNFPSTINLLTGDRIIQNFYSEEVDYFDRPIPTPLSEDASDYYYYYIQDTLALDNKVVFKIYFSPLDDTDPGFYGSIFIADETFNLLKLDVLINSAANPGGIFDKVNIFQQFQEYNNIPMPIDYRLFVTGNFLGIAKFGFDVSTIMYNYKINHQIDDDFFDMTVLKVTPDADKKDSDYWNSIPTIPVTPQETIAYHRIDSLESIETTFWDRFSFLSTSVSLDDHWSISGPLDIYGFNRVQGNSLNFGVSGYRLNDKRMRLSLGTGYGFADEKFKFALSGRYLFGDYRNHRLDISIYNDLEDLFSENIEYNKLTSTVLSLFSKYDFRDYYYTKGFKVEFDSQIFPILSFSVGFENRNDETAVNQSDFSFFNRDDSYSKNLKIYDANLNILKFGFDFDFRNFIEDGYFRRRTSFSSGNIFFGGNLLISKNSLIKSDLDFTIYKLYLRGWFNSFSSSRTQFRISSFYSEDNVPFQILKALPGNIESIGKRYSFRTLKIGEIYGDQIVTLNIENNLRDELFRFLNIPYLEKWQLNLGVHFNAAYVKISDNSKNILLYEPNEFLKPFYEAGFSIGQAIFPFRLEFTWKLNHFGRNDFVIGINSGMF